MERLSQFSTLKDIFENQNFDIFDKFVDNFGKSDNDLHIYIVWQKHIFFPLDTFVITCPILSKNLGRFFKFGPIPISFKWLFKNA